MPGPTGLLIGGVRLDLAIRVDATEIFLRRIDDIAKADARTAVRAAGDKWYKEVQRHVAYDTGFMHDHVRVSYSEKEYTFEGGWDEGDFAAAGLPFYPPFPEFGTRFQRAQPSIEPAFNLVSRRLANDLATIVQQSITRANR